MSFLQYLPGASVFHRLRLPTKVVLFGGMTVLALWFTDLGRLLSLMLLLVVFIAVIRIPWRYLKQIVFVGAIVVAMFTLWSSIFYPGQVVVFSIPLSLLKIGELRITMDGAIFGFAASLRLLVVALAWTIVAVSTPPTEVLATLGMLRAPILLSFALIATLRFVPVLARDFQTIMDAQRSRGLELQKGIVKRLRNLVPLIVPFMNVALSRSEDLAVVMAAKGFGGIVRWAPAEETKLRRVDVAVIALTMVGVVFGLLSDA